MHADQDIGQSHAYWFKRNDSGEWSIRTESQEEKMAQQVWRTVIQKELQIARQELAKIGGAEGHRKHSRYVQRWLEESAGLLKKVSSV
jgi:hypothetical protein